MIVLGIDPGLSACGWGLLSIDGSSRRLLASDTIYTDPSADIETRLDEIGLRVFPFMRRAELVGLEDQFNVWHGRGKEHQTNNDARRVEDVLSVLRGLALSIRVPRHVILPQRIRKHLGLARNADKEAIGQMVRALVGDVPEAGAISKHAIDGIAHAIAAEKEAHAASLMQHRLPGTEAKPRRRRGPVVHVRRQA